MPSLCVSVCYNQQQPTLLDRQAQFNSHQVSSQETFVGIEKNAGLFVCLLFAFLD